MANQNTRLKGHGVAALLAGAKLRVRPQDFGGGQVQFAVGTDEEIGSLLKVYLCDPDGEEVARIFPGPPISFETDSEFVVFNNSVSTVSVIVGQVNTALGRRASTNSPAGADAGGGASSGGGSSSDFGGGGPSGGGSGPYSVGGGKHNHRRV